jgi:DNA-binding transcriptional ArsR family regulator
MPIDAQRSQPLQVDVDWAPAFELLASFIAFTHSGHKHTLQELGTDWVAEVQQRLPADYAPRLRHAGASASTKAKHDFELLILLAHACPGERDADGWLDWLAQLSAGDAYEAVAGLVADTGSVLPRDFATWREKIVNLLRTWNTHYFRTFDPDVLAALRADADCVRAQLGATPPGELVEQVTNGIWIESDMQRVLLVPQYHMRPYNHDCTLADGQILLYPAELTCDPADGPSAALMRLTRGLGDESRLRILRFLATSPRSLTEVARFGGLSQPTVHHHLTQLRSAGLVRVHCSLSAPVRYTLRPHALERLVQQLGTYLEPAPLKGDG